MNKHKLKVIAAVCSGVLLTGCATWQQSAGLATLGCAGVGILTGVLTKNAAIGAGSSAGCLALAAIGIYSYHTSQTRTVQQDQQLYPYAPVSSTEVKIRNATASPEMVKAGDTVKLVLDYSVMKTFPDRPIKRPLGGSGAEIDFPTPAKMPPGTYVIEYKVQAGTSYDVRPVVFVVGT